MRQSFSTRSLRGSLGRTAGRASLAILLCATGSWAAAAPVSFTYTGKPLSSLVAGSHFTAADFVTGTVTLDITPGVAGSSAASIWSLTSSMSGSTAPAASFSMTNSTSGLTIISGRNTFAWNASGQITGWFLDVEANVIGGLGNDGLRVCGGTSCSVQFADVAKVDGNSIFARNTNPGFIGSWTQQQTAAIPEPTSLALAVLALVGLGASRRRRTRS